MVPLFDFKNELKHSNTPPEYISLTVGTEFIMHKNVASHQNSKHSKKK